MKIPFKFLPAAWGLKGKSFERAKLEYELADGYDKELKLLELDFDDGSTERAVAKANLDFKFKKLTEKQKEKVVATAKREPWVDVINFDVDPANPSNTCAFELDWNDLFIVELKRNGYKGISDEHIIQQWFDDLCTNAAAESSANQLTDSDSAPSSVIQRKDGRSEYY